MKRLSIKKLSALGIILLAASAVASSSIVAKTKTSKAEDCNGMLVGSTSPDDGGFGMDLTCVQAVDDGDCWTITGSGPGTGTSSGTSNGVTTSLDTRLSYGVFDCVMG